MKIALLTLMTIASLAAFAVPALALGEGEVLTIKRGEDQQVVEILIPSDATDAEMEQLASLLNSLEPSEQR